MAVPLFKTFWDVTRYLNDEIVRYHLRRRGAPPADLKARLGTQYTDIDTGELYVMQSTGWDGPK
jgi:hypothetical protein